MKKQTASILLALSLAGAPSVWAFEDPAKDKGSEEVVEAKKAKESQPTAAAAPQEVGNFGAYNVITSVELGVRGVSVNGEADKYRSDFNYQPGFQVFNSSLLMKAGPGQGMLFDNLSVTSYGWGGEPSQYLRVNADKTRWYRFDATYRELDYFNSLRNFAAPVRTLTDAPSQHTSNTEFKLGDFDLTLLPQNERFRLNLGYSMERNSGPSRSTYDYSRDEFPILAPVRVEANNYRIGFDAKAWVFDISFQQGFRYYKEDSTYSIELTEPGPPPFNPGNQPPPNTTTITSFGREFPIRGETPYTRLSIHTFLAKRVDITARYVYSSARTDFELFENLTGTDFQGNKVVLDTVSARGHAKRPNGLGDLGVTVYVTDKFRVSDTVRINNFRINGAQDFFEGIFRTRQTPFGESPLPPLLTDELTFTLTKYRLVTNSFEGDYQFHPRFSAHFGHRYSDRRIERGDLVREPDSTEHIEAEPFDNRTNSYFGGFKARPLSIWTLYFDFETGESDNVFTRVGNYDYKNFRVRSIVRPTNRLTINTSLITRDNTNPALTDEEPQRFFGSDINTRVFSGSADWFGNERLALSGGYTYSHVTSEAEIVFFSAGRREGLSRYFIRNHFAFLNLFSQIHSRVNFSAGYRFNWDGGQGDRRGTDLTVPITTPRPEIVTSFPLQFQSPEFRVSVKVHNNIDWNVGYQWYDYKEKFPNFQPYNAHLPYTSLRFYFGGER